MKAIALHAAGEYSFESDWPQPEQPDGWAIVRVHAAGICGSDLTRFGVTGSYHHPMILGHEFAGAVHAPASGTSRYRAGDRVAVLPLIPCGVCSECRAGEPFHCENYSFLGSRIDGGFAEYVAVPDENLVALPDSVTPALGAMIEPTAVALHVARRSGVRAGDDVLILGAGSIGLLIGFWLRVFGAARVVMSDVRSQSLDMARAAGFREAIEPNTAADSAFDVVVEAAGSPSALLRAIECVRRRGSVTVVGRSATDTLIPVESFERLMRKEVKLLGCWGYNVERDLEFILQKLADRSIPGETLITRRVSIEDAPKLIDEMTAGTSYYCKAMVELT